MNVGIIGNGVVGGATAEAFGRAGHVVRRYDEDPHRQTHRLVDVLDESDLIFVCLPTPQYEDGSCDTSVICRFFGALDPMHRGARNFALRSTVPVGFTRWLSKMFNVSNVVHFPEFLTARTAVEDAANPKRLIIGVPRYNNGVQEAAECALRELLASTFREVRQHLMSSDESEFVKLMQNAFSAIKVAAFNEFRRFADLSFLDWKRCLSALLAGGWVNPMHTQVPGPDGKRGFGGACLPKDAANLAACMRDAGIAPVMIEAALARNSQIDRGKIEL